MNRSLAALLIAGLTSCQVIVGLTGRSSGTTKQACLHNSDCATSDVCLFQTCGVACVKDVDCEPGARCLNTSTGAACVTSALASCGSQACPAGTTCSEGACRTPCGGDSAGACRSDQSCSAANVCIGTESAHDVAGQGGSSAVAMGGTSGGGGSDGGVASKLGASCSVSAQRTCDGQASPQQVICDLTAGKWVANGLCGSDELCDNAAGPMQGTCRNVVPECAAQVGGDHVCVNGELHACGNDLVTTELVDACATASGECSRCRPQEIATGQGTPWSVVVDQTNVYWSSANGIMKAPLGGGMTNQIVNAATNLTPIAIDGTNVYWLTNSDPTSKMPAFSMQSAPLIGGAVAMPRVLSTGKDAFRSWVAVLGSNLYLAMSTDNGSWVVTRVPVTDGPPTDLASGAGSTTEFVGGIAVDAKNVYWLLAGSGQVMKVPVDGGEATVLASGQMAPRALAIDEKSVYWTVGNGAGVTKVGIAGGDTSPLSTVSGQTGGLGVGQAEVAIAVDASYAYWTSPAANLVLKVPKAGGAALTVASGQHPEGIAVDSTRIYWANSGGGSIASIAK